MATGGTTSSSDESVLAAASSLSELNAGAKILRGAAYVAGIIWILALIMSFWTLWDQYSTVALGQAETARLPRVIAGTASSTWGYLIAAVVAYGASLYIESRRLPVLLDAIGDDEVEEEIVEVEVTPLDGPGAPV